MATKNLNLPSPSVGFSSYFEVRNHYWHYVNDIGATKYPENDYVVSQEIQPLRAVIDLLVTPTSASVSLRAKEENNPELCMVFSVLRVVCGSTIWIKSGVNNPYLSIAGIKIFDSEITIQCQIFFSLPLDVYWTPPIVAATWNTCRLMSSLRVKSELKSTALNKLEGMDSFVLWTKQITDHPWTVKLYSINHGVFVTIDLPDNVELHDQKLRVSIMNQDEVVFKTLVLPVIRGKRSSVSMKLINMKKLSMLTSSFQRPYKVEITVANKLYSNSSVTELKNGAPRAVFLATNYQKMLEDKYGVKC